MGMQRSTICSCGAVPLSVALLQRMKKVHIWAWLRIRLTKSRGVQHTLSCVYIIIRHIWPLISFSIGASANLPRFELASAVLKFSSLYFRTYLPSCMDSNTHLPPCLFLYRRICHCISFSWSSHLSPIFFLWMLCYLISSLWTHLPLKGTVSRDFLLQVFHESPSPKPLKMTVGSFRTFLKILGDIRKSRCTTGTNDTGGK